MTLAASSLCVSLNGGISFVVPAPWSIVAGLCSAISALSFWLGSPPKSRKIAFFYSTGMILYDIFGGTGQVAWFGILNEAFTFISSFVGVLRLDIKKKPKKTEDTAEEPTEDVSEEKNGK